MGLFLFDVDGTLITAGTAVHRDAFVHVFRKVYGLSLSLDGISAAGRTDAWLLAEPLRRHGVSPEQIETGKREAFTLMGDYVEEHLGDLRHCVLPGVPEVLAELDSQKHVLGMLTGNIRRVALAKMARAGLGSFFDTGGFGDESEVRADLVPIALENTGTLAGRSMAPRNTAVIGDTPLDVEAGRRGETRTVGVATGPFTIDDLQKAGADFVLPSFADSASAVAALVSLVS